MTTMTQVRRQWRKCKRCGLWKTRDNYVHGRGDPITRILFVGEGPGRDEDVVGLPFIGKAGRLLQAALIASGIKGARYIANLVGCWPPGNRVPTQEEVKACEPRLNSIIRAMRNLRVVVPLGGTAALYLLSARHITRTRGILHEFERGGKTLIGIPTFHPSHVDRTGGINGPNFPLLVKDLKMALKEASDA